eukprot:308466-Chlamydomonas_euryale.AAC.10
MQQNISTHAATFTQHPLQRCSMSAHATLQFIGATECPLKLTCGKCLHWIASLHAHGVLLLHPAGVEHAAGATQGLDLLRRRLHRTYCCACCIGTARLPRDAGTAATAVAALRVLAAPPPAARCAGGRDRSRREADGGFEHPLRLAHPRRGQEHRA